MIFDAHGDIWTDVTVKRQKGNKDVFKNFHLEKYCKGQVNAGIFVIWVDPPYDKNPRQRALEIIENMSVEITTNQDIFKIVKKYDHIGEAIDSNKFAIILGSEGLSYIGKNVGLINALYLFGVRHATLTWNEENELATGVKGNPNRGLTQYGVEAVKRLEELGMIVDVSHANEKTFWDICETTTKPIIASHSNCKALCKAPRNLTDEQLKAISAKGGVVGLNAFSDFVADEIEDRDIEHLANHVDHMVEVMGIDHVGFGFDFDDYLEGDTLSAFAEGDAKTIGFENITKVPKMIELLEKKGYSSEDIEKIKYKNFLRVIKQILN
ncbi:dipeptidase [Clostridium sp. Cult3]|uniref:dipeptidase n=1 Tax=Clostridium sp. Cult3 TaxID=2079004 RepID=UPI001F3DCFC2|nr:dipeptidase [Clostridium sp. Cult3]MCF6460689.1 peptidase M19 [Clostridium sp. Cult3]